MDKPIWTDGSDEDLLGDLRQGEFGNAISYWQEIGEHGKSRHHDDVWQSQTKQIFAKLPARFPDVYQITRDDEKGRHHERENACLQMRISIPETHDMDEDHQYDENSSDEI